VQHFLQKYSEENERPAAPHYAEALRPLVSYAWPGNVRELENTIERAVVLSSDSDIGVDLLPDTSWAGAASVPAGRGWEPRCSSIMEDCERRIIIDMLEKCGWNQTEAAERFHVPLSTLNQKIKRLAIEIKKKNTRTDFAH
jgi:DNA-binding NtrC family response regulator